MVEHAAVNRGVVGSSPTRGGGVNHFVINSKRPVNKMFTGFLLCTKFIISNREIDRMGAKMTMRMVTGNRQGQRCSSYLTFTVAGMQPEAADREILFPLVSF